MSTSTAAAPAETAATTKTTSGTEVVVLPTLMRSIKSEWVKLKSIRSPRIIFGVTAVLVAGVSLAIMIATQNAGAELGFVGDFKVDALTIMPMANYLGVMAIVVIGALIGSGDFQHKTIAPTLAHQPSRMKFLLAKTTLTSALSLVMALLFIVITIGVGLAVSGQLGTYTPVTTGPAAGAGDVVTEPAALYLVDLLPVALAHMMLAGLFGLALGLATRNTTFAVSGFFVLRFVEVALASGRSHWALNLLPFRAGDRILPYIAGSDDPQRFESPMASAVIYMTVIGLMMTFGMLRTFRQDAV